MWQAKGNILPSVVNTLEVLKQSVIAMKRRINPIVTNFLVLSVALILSDKR